MRKSQKLRAKNAVKVVRIKAKNANRQYTGAFSVCKGVMSKRSTRANNPEPNIQHLDELVYLDGTLTGVSNFTVCEVPRPIANEWFNSAGQRK